MANDPSEKIPPPSEGPASEKPAEPPAPPATAAEAPPKPAGPAQDKPAPPAKPAAAAKPAAPPPKKEEPLKPAPLDNELVQRARARFPDGILEAWVDRKQNILVVDREQLARIARYFRDEEQFNMLTDLTAVDFPNREKRFEVVLNLYSFPKNERLRLKVHAAEGELVPSVTAVWPTANWLEREVFDMFGIRFDGHPKLTRILLPDEWQGHPLRKDYDILKQDTAWVRENLGIESGQ
jgi:NADH-quinone oxidoreductase subunit C